MFVCGRVATLLREGSSKEGPGRQPEVARRMCPEPALQSHCKHSLPGGLPVQWALLTSKRGEPQLDAAGGAGSMSGSGRPCLGSGPRPPSRGSQGPEEVAPLSA